MSIKNKGRLVFIMIGSVLFCLALMQYSYIEGRMFQISVRCENALLTAQVLDNYYEQQQELNSGKVMKKTVPDVTLWNEIKGVSVNADEYFSGNGYTLAEGYGNLQRILPGHLIRGDYPGKNDTSGCAVSQKGAIELYGNDQVIGKELTLSGKTYIIRGIIDWDEKYLWVQNPDAKGFRNVELVYRNEIPQVSETRQWVAQMGGGAILAVLAGSSCRAYVRLFITFPLWVLWIVFLGNLFRAVKRIRKRYLKNAVYFIVITAGLFITAVGLKYSICFGTDYIPTRWSDFAFFQNKWESVKIAAKEIQRLPALPGDQELLAHSKSAVWLSAASAGIMIISFGTRGSGGNLFSGSHNVEK